MWQDPEYEQHTGQHWRRVTALLATQESCARTVRKDYAAFQHKVALEALRHCHYSQAAIPLFLLTSSQKLSGHLSGLSVSFSTSTRYRNLKNTVGFEPLQAAAGLSYLSNWDNVFSRLQQEWSVWRRRGTHTWWDTNPYKEQGERSGWFPGDFFWSYLLAGNPGQMENISEPTARRTALSSEWRKS